MIDVRMAGIGMTSARTRDRLVQRLAQGLEGFTSHTHPLSQHHIQFDSLLPLYGTAHQAGTVRCGAVRCGPKILGARPVVQGPRTGQSVCGRLRAFRHQRRGESHLDHRGQRHARGRPPEGQIGGKGLARPVKALIPPQDRPLKLGNCYRPKSIRDIARATSGAGNIELCV